MSLKELTDKLAYDSLKAKIALYEQRIEQVTKRLGNAKTWFQKDKFKRSIAYSQERLERIKNKLKEIEK